MKLQWMAIVAAACLAACGSETVKAPAAIQQPESQQPASVQAVPAAQSGRILTGSGTIEGRAYASYNVEGKKGQTLKAVVKGAHVDAVLYGYDDFMSGEPYVLPEDGTYEVRVVQPANFARKGEKSSYELVIEVK